MEQPILQLVNVAKSLGEFTLSGVSIDLMAGEFLLLAGANGAGKSTLIDLTAGVLRPDQGFVRMFGAPGEELSEAERQQISVSLGVTDMAENMTVNRFIRSTALLCKEWDGVVADNLLRRFDIPRKKKLKELSKGMKVKLSLIIAMSRVFRILILDEPLSGLDPGSRKHVLDLLRALKARKTTIVFGTNDFGGIGDLVDKVIVLSRGNVLYNMTSEDFLSLWSRVETEAEDLNGLAPSILSRIREGDRLTYYLKEKCDDVRQAVRLKDTNVRRANLDEIIPLLI